MCAALLSLTSLSFCLLTAPTEQKPANLYLWSKWKKMYLKILGEEEWWFLRLGGKQELLIQQWRCSLFHWIYHTMINYCLFLELQTIAAPVLAQVPLEAAKKPHRDPGQREERSSFSRAYWTCSWHQENRFFLLKSTVTNLNLILFFKAFPERVDFLWFSGCQGWLTDQPFLESYRPRSQADISSKQSSLKSC